MLSHLLPYLSFKKPHILLCLVPGSCCCTCAYVSPELTTQFCILFQATCALLLLLATWRSWLLQKKQSLSQAAWAAASYECLIPGRSSADRKRPKLVNCGPAYNTRQPSARLDNTARYNGLLRFSARRNTSPQIGYYRLMWDEWRSNYSGQGNRPPVS